MSVIANRLSVTVSTLTTNMNGLERKGYIMRERSTKDKRVVHVLLTDKDMHIVVGDVPVLLGDHGLRLHVHHMVEKTNV